MRLILFDIDGTLLLSGGAGNRAFKTALEQVFQLPNGLAGVRAAGKTDLQIVREVLKRFDQEERFTPERISELFEVYVSLLRKEISTSEHFRVLAGARELVCTLSRRKHFLLGLATGNIEEGAQLKLERAGFKSFFTFGAFGSDAEDRTNLISLAIERGRQRIAPIEAEAVFMIGDTPRDIVHGKDAGARTVGVAGTAYSLDALTAYKPDLAVESLEPIEPILEFLETGN